MYSIQEVLCQCGLSKQEAMVYEAAIQLGPVPVATLARKMNRNRVTIYSVMKKLIAQGIAHTSQQGKTTYYQVISPEELVQLVEKRLNLIQQHLPLMQSLHNESVYRPAINYFEGAKGLQLLYKDILTSSSPLSMFMGIDYIDQSFKSFIDSTFVPERTKRKIHTRVIAPNTANMQAYLPYDDSSLRKMKLVDPAKLNFTNEITIYDHNKIALALFSENELVGLSVTSDNLAKSLQDIFDLLRELL